MLNSTRAENILENIEAELEDIDAGVNAIASGLEEMAKLGYLTVTTSALPELTSVKNQLNAFVMSLSVGCLMQGQPAVLTEEQIDLIDLAREAGIAGDKSILEEGMRKAGLIP